jgi:outer membrane protein assembly factor BamB
MSKSTTRTIADLVFLAFNKHVIALDRYTGEKVWHWDVPKGGGFVALLLDGDRLIASSQGYTYCLDPLFGQVVWNNPLEGMGLGIPSLVSANAPLNPSAAAAAVVAQQQKQATASAAIV